MKMKKEENDHHHQEKEKEKEKEDNVTEEEAFQEAFKTLGFAKLTPPPQGAEHAFERSAIQEDYYIQKYEVVLGRLSKTSNVDVILGTS